MDVLTDPQLSNLHRTGRQNTMGIDCVGIRSLGPGLGGDQVAEAHSEKRRRVLGEYYPVRNDTQVALAVAMREYRQYQVYARGSLQKTL